MNECNIIFSPIKAKKKKKRIYHRICIICNNPYETISKKSRKCTNCWKGGCNASASKKRIIKREINKIKLKKKSIHNFALTAK